MPFCLRTALTGSAKPCLVNQASKIEQEGSKIPASAGSWAEVCTLEAEINWRRFLESLLARGLTGVELIISDDHAELKASLSGGASFRSLAAISVPSAAERLRFFMEGPASTR